MHTADHPNSRPPLGRDSTDARGFPALTGLRAVAATMVYWHHYPPSAALVGQFAHFFFTELHIGVTIFFVLSGFLIYLRHSSAESLDRVPLIRYAFHRFARIYPMYFLVVVGMAVWKAFYDPAHLSFSNLALVILGQLTFIRGFSDKYKFIGVGQGWTLTVEMTFYVLYPVLLKWIRRIGFAAVLLFVYAAGLLLYGLGVALHRDSFFTPFLFVLGYTFFGRALEFFAGMALADYVGRKGIGGSPSGISEQRRSLPWCTIAGVLGIASCLSVVALMHPSGSPDGQYGAFDRFIFILILPLCVCALMYGLVRERTWLARFFGSRVMVTLGASSYCFYLIHVGGPDLMIGKWILTIGTLPGYFVILLVSVLLWKWVEEPLRRLILSHHLFRRTQPARG